MDMMPDGDRYARMPLRRTGRSGLMLPAMSLGLWQNFGGDRPIETQRAIIRRADGATAQKPSEWIPKTETSAR